MSWHASTDAGPWNDSLAGVIDDPDFTRPVVWRPGEAVDSDTDGSTDYEFGDPVEMELLIVSPEVSPFDRAVEGPDEDVEYALCAMLERGITRGDRLAFDDARDESPGLYRVGTPEVTDFDGDRIAWYALTADERGDSSDEESGGYPVR
ncbi:hypothetical protein [Halalkalicoccus jeotgali]|uniref:Uncharacterized protein n=1 Tax=Halalkalicoccus jeotgali (strain DSM 18796 / CECT 7217 / JCM 14584 / KCTC 4019 / B3) TaxID=795797 RepID=D8J9V4_HALJB|nr:hypothetical protein [Halalkalicoccus jeotgali]ADJ14476.1 hypothetical protein HacjB3_05425 [Halalkalicoccus jeotgali B3]ELY40190.1 hypothetical protein C497_03800 [Halalkalicoccus jeotgali B3]